MPHNERTTTPPQNPISVQNVILQSLNRSSSSGVDDRDEENPGPFHMPTWGNREAQSNGRITYSLRSEERGEGRAERTQQEDIQEVETRDPRSNSTDRGSALNEDRDRTLASDSRARTAADRSSESQLGVEVVYESGREEAADSLEWDLPEEERDREAQERRGVIRGAIQPHEPGREGTSARGDSEEASVQGNISSRNSSLLSRISEWEEQSNSTPLARSSSIPPARIRYPGTDTFIAYLRRFRALQLVRVVDEMGQETWNSWYTLLSATDENAEVVTERDRRHFRQAINSLSDDLAGILEIAVEDGLNLREATQLISYFTAYVLAAPRSEWRYPLAAAIWHALHEVWDFQGSAGWLPSERMHRVVYERYWKPNDYERITQLLDGLSRNDWQTEDYQRLLPREFRQQLREEADIAVGNVDGETFDSAAETAVEGAPEEPIHQQVEEGREGSVDGITGTTTSSPDLFITTTGQVVVFGTSTIISQYRIQNTTQFSIWGSLGIRPLRRSSLWPHQMTDLEFLNFLRERSRPLAQGLPLDAADPTVNNHIPRSLAGAEHRELTSATEWQQFRRNRRWLQPIARFIFLRAIADGLPVAEAAPLLQYWIHFRVCMLAPTTRRLEVYVLIVAMLEGWGGWRPSSQMYEDLYELGEIRSDDLDVFSTSRLSRSRSSNSISQSWEEDDPVTQDETALTKTAHILAHIAMAEHLSPSQARTDYQNILFILKVIMRIVWIPHVFEPQENGLYGDIWTGPGTETLRASIFLFFNNDSFGAEARYEMRLLLDYPPEPDVRLSLLLGLAAFAVDTNPYDPVLPGDRRVVTQYERLNSSAANPGAGQLNLLGLMRAFIEEWTLDKNSPQGQTNRELSIVQNALNRGLPAIFVEQTVRSWARLSAWALRQEDERESRWTAIRADRLERIFEQELELRVLPANSPENRAVEDLPEEETSTLLSIGGNSDTTSEEQEIVGQMENLAVDENTEAAYRQGLASLPAAEIAIFEQIRADPYWGEREVWHMVHRWIEDAASLSPAMRTRREEVLKVWIQEWKSEVEDAEATIERNSESAMPELQV